MQLSVNNTTLYYEVTGRGEPLILLHGNGEDHTIFDRAAQALAPRFTCFLPDSRGHGQSAPADTLSYETMADDIIGFIDALGLRRPVLYGFSDGGIIGLMVAMKRPQLPSRLIISGANLNPRGMKPSLWLTLKLTTLFKKDPKLLLMLHEPQIPPEALSAIAVPTLVLAGSRDLIREAHTRLIAASVPGARLSILPGETHGSYIVHSEKIARIILEETGA